MLYFHSPIRIYIGEQVAMDKKTKKKLEIVRKNLQHLRQQLAGAKKQDDEPGEITRLEDEIKRLESEAVKLKEG